MTSYDQQGARDMYLNTNFTQKEIAEKLGINPKTIYLWIKKGKWDEMKAAARQAPGIIQQQLYNHITAINESIAAREDRVPTFQEVEMLRKLIVSTKHMQQMSVGTYIQAFQELTGFIGPHTNDLEFTKRVAVVADEYIKGLIHNKQFHIEEKVRNTTEAIKELDGDLPTPTCRSYSQVCHPDAGRNSHISNTTCCQPMSPGIYPESFGSDGVEPMSSTDKSNTSTADNIDSQVCHPEANDPECFRDTHEHSPQVCHPDEGRNSHMSTDHEPHNTSLSPSEPQGGAGFGEPARTFQLGGDRGEASLSVGHESGNDAKEENPANPSPSAISAEISTNPLPDSVSLPDREMKTVPTPPDQLEKQAEEIEQTITRKDYIKYEYLLEDKTDDPSQTVDFNGVKANLMTVQYNLKQFEEPEWRRKFLPREEVIRLFIISAARRA